MSQKLPYRDPLGQIWLSAAARLGMRVERVKDVYASWDGRGTLQIAVDDDLDPDDSIGQMILHEICHALVAGPGALSRPDWGLDNTSDRDVVSEHATNRLQAALADEHGLRRFFATTTEFRTYYDALPADPLAPSEDPAAALAAEAYRRAREGTWWSVIQSSLAATAALAAALRGFERGTLWELAEPLHSTGFVLGADASKTCDTCAWRAPAEDGGPGLFCRRARLAGRPSVLAESERACRDHEPRLTEIDCGACGACCREGFHLVPVAADDPVRERNPELVREDSSGAHIPRPGGRCLALAVGGGGATYRCRIYDHRPSACGEFEIGGDACLEARRRVGLTR